jgi:hypothetical protein
LQPAPALAAENLFLRKQLAQYQERQVKPRRANDAMRMALLAKPLFRLAKGSDDGATGDSDPLASLGIPIVLALESPTGAVLTSPRHIPVLRRAGEWSPTHDAVVGARVVGP